MYLEEVRKIMQVMHVFEVESVDLAFYRLKDLSYDWVVAWNKSRGDDVASMTWKIFQDTFLDKFFLLEIRESKIEEFMNLKQGSMTVKEYCLKLNHLAKYAPNLITDTQESMSSFITGVSGLVVKEYRATMLNKELDLPRLMLHARQIKSDKFREIDRARGNNMARFKQHEYRQTRSHRGNLPQFQSRSSMLVPSSASAPPPRGRQEQGYRPIVSRSQNTVSNQPNYPQCDKCSRTHLGECLAEQRGCLGYCKMGHRLIECSYARKGNRDVRP